MSRYLKVTLKEFLDMREAIETNATAAASGSDDDVSEAERAVKASRSIEKRNGIEPPDHVQTD